MEDIPKIINSGLILEPIDPRMWVWRGITGIPEEKPLVASGMDWMPYLATDEIQRFNGFDTSSCVSFSCLNNFETLLFYKLVNKMISNENYNWLQVNGYLDDQDRPNFSDRYIAALSGTTKKGNSAGKVMDTVLNYGLIPEAMHPATTALSFENYVNTALITPEMFDIGKEFKKRFKLAYEVVFVGENQTLLDAVRYSPLQVFIHAWGQYVDGLFKKTLENINHAVTFFGGEQEKYLYEHDSYSLYGSYKAKLAWDYIFYTSAFKFSINEIAGEVPEQPVLPNIKNDTLIQLTETGHPDSGRISMHLNGMKFIDDLDKILGTYHMRKPLNEERRQTVSIKEWEALKSVNLKMQPV